MTEPAGPPTSSEIVFYQGEDGRSRIQVRLDGGTVWLTQRLLADLFQKDVRTINEHLQNIFEEGEADPAATIRKFRIVQTEGNREVARLVDHYNLDVILAVGYRVRSLRGTQFRRWATERLTEYVVKGFRVVRLGTTKSERKALRAYRAGEGDVTRLAALSGLTTERVEQLLPLLASKEASLDARTDEGGSAEDRLASPLPSPEEEAAAHERASQALVAVGDALCVLTDRERLIVSERMMTEDPPTLQALGTRLGVSKERVRQIEERAMSKLKDKLGDFSGVAHLTSAA